MEITARIFKNNGEGKLKARAEITLGGEFVARGFRVMEGEKVCSLLSRRDRSTRRTERMYILTSSSRLLPKAGKKS